MPESTPEIIASAFFASFALLFLLLNSGLGTLVLDRPNARSLHVSPIPRIGGLAILMGAIIGTYIAGPPGSAVQRMIVGVVALAVLSLADDACNLPILPRLLMHVAICIFGLWPMLSGTPWLYWLPVVGAMVWFVNLYNFMDGADGLAGGMAVFGFGFLAVAALLGNAPAFYLWPLAMASAAGAFLCFNFHPARVFMGDCGAVPLGFSAAALSMQGWFEGAWPSWYPLFVFAPFIADASCTLIRRILRGERFWEAHREHYYQRLIRMNWTHRKTALTYYGLMLAYGGTAFFSLALSPQAAGIVLGFGLLVGVVLMSVVDRKWQKYSAAQRKQNDDHG